MSGKVATMPSGLEISYWDAQAVAARLEEMGDTMRRMSVPGCWPAGYKSNWPDYIRDFWDEWSNAYDPVTKTVNAPKVRPGPPTAAAITRMDESVEWFRYVEHTYGERTYQKRAVLWAYSQGFKIARISRETGLHRETIRAWVNEAIDDIVRRLNTNVDPGK